MANSKTPATAPIVTPIATPIGTLLATEHHLMLEAGAGSGKTTAVVKKVMRELGFDPLSQPTRTLALSELVAITFTRKAAAELRERLRRELLTRAHGSKGRDREYWAGQAFSLDKARIGTIDSFAMALIREHGSLLGLDGSVQVLSEGEAGMLLERLANRDLEKYVSRGHLGAIQLVRQFGTVGALQIMTDAFNRPERIQRTKAMFERKQLDWQKIAAKNDFKLLPADKVLEPEAREMALFLIESADNTWNYLRQEGLLTMSYALWAAYLLSKEEVVQNAFRNTTRFVAVDEHQDTSRLQAQLLFNLIGLPSTDAVPVVRALFVGDPKQSIYAFRHADITMWSKTAKLVIESGGQIVQLSDNWRSHPNIVTFFDSFFGRLFNNGQSSDKPFSKYERIYRSLQPNRSRATAGGTVEILVPEQKGIEQTAALVAKRIKEMLANPADWPVMFHLPDGQESTRPVRPSDIAILSRELKRAGDIYAAALSAENIPSTLTAGRGLYARTEIRDLVNMLSAILDPTDSLVLTSYLRSPLAHLSDAQVALLAKDGSIWQNMSASEDPQVKSVYNSLLRYRSLTNRLAPADLLRLIISDTSYRAFLAGSPDGLGSVRAVDRFIEIAATNTPSLARFVTSIAAKVRTAEREEEVPVHGAIEEKVNITTIHSAKGLEWPVVFVVGIDEPVMRAVDATTPQWTDLGGLVLPTEVVIADGTVSDALAPSAMWRQVRADLTMAGYAEARRLVYVACTRARDHLFLAGNLATNKQGNPEKPRGLSSSWEFMNRDTVDRWLRFIYPGLSQKSTKILDTRLTPAAELKVSYSSSGIMPEPVECAPWPLVAENLAETQATFALSSPVKNTGLIKRSWTASELLQYSIEPWRHYFSYRHSLSQTGLSLSREARKKMITPAIRGTILHQYLRSFTPDATPAEHIQSMRSIVLRHIPLADPELGLAVTRLLAHVAGYQASGIAAALANAKTVYHELPFWHVVDSDTQLEGVIDLVWEDVSGQWHIADFKTAQLEAVGPVLDAILDAQAQEYEIQAGVYALALEATVGTKLTDFTFVFTDSGQTRRFEITSSWLINWRERILNIITAIRANDYGAPPVYRAKTCLSCPFRRLCAPSGDPNPYTASTSVLLEEAEENWPELLSA